MYCIYEFIIINTQHIDAYSCIQLTYENREIRINNRKKLEEIFTFELIYKVYKYIAGAYTKLYHSNVSIIIIIM